MRALVGGALLILATLFPALAQEAVPLSADALSTLGRQREDNPEVHRRNTFKIDRRADGTGEGVSYHGTDVYVGTFRRSTSPVTGRLTHWVFDKGVFSRHNGDRYVGTFYFFHDAYNEREAAPSPMPQGGTYIMVGDYVPKSGPGHSGIYYGWTTQGLFNSGWVEADQAFLTEFEEGRRRQVAYYKEQIRQEQREAASGFSFGQILALGLGAAVIGVADIPATDALRIGGAFASDVLSGGKTNALNQFISTQQSAAAAAAGGRAAGLGPSSTPGAPPGSATATYKNEQVTVSCPSGVSSVIPISYKTAACRDAMVTFAKVYSCNLIDDFASAGATCQSACGDPQCLQ
jgi:hypothetical protein